MPAPLCTLQKDILNLVYLCEHFGLPDVAAYWEQVVRLKDYQKSRFVQRMVRMMFNTVSDKRIAVWGFAFKKDTKDTRESAAIYVRRDLLEERPKLSILRPPRLRSANPRGTRTSDARSGRPD